MSQSVAIDDAVVESVMCDLMDGQVAVVLTLSPPLRDRYMENLRTYVRAALVRAFDPDARAKREDAA